MGYFHGWKDHLKNRITLVKGGFKRYFRGSKVFFYAFHLIPLGAFFFPFQLVDWIVCFGLFWVRMFFVTAGYHRYFSHRTFKTSRVFQFILAFFAQTSAQKGVLWWSSHHRTHHKHSDQEGDPHSRKQKGFYYSHIGWILNEKSDATHTGLIKDLTKFPDLVWLNKYYWIPPAILGAVILAFGGISMFAIGFCLSTVILFHSTFTINSLMHHVGKSNYVTGDTSKNSFILAILTLGEGWHNNHHYFQGSCRQGFFWWEFDPTYYILWVFEKIGLIQKIKNVPISIRNKR